MLGGEARQRRHHRRLAHPALPGHDDHPGPATESARIQPSSSTPAPLGEQIRRLATAFLVLGSLVLAAPPGRAAPAPGAIDVIEVSGRIDPIQADFVKRSLVEAEKGHDEVLVIQLDSPGALIDQSSLDVLAFRLAHARVPVAVWVGPSGSRAYGGANRLVTAAGLAGMAPGTHVGKDPGGPRNSPLSVSRALGATEAKARGAVDVVAPTLGEFIVGLDGQTVGGQVLSTAKVVPDGESLRRQAAGDVRFAKLGIGERVLHAAASPQVAYLLLVIGLLLIVFEFFTAGIGLAGAVGAGSLILAAYGLAVLPTNPVALALVVIGVGGLAIDVQAGAPRAWTVIGTIALLIGSWRLFGDGVSVSWIAILVIVAGSVLLMVAGMASMLRARFSTPTIGRESMVGRMGEADTGINPDGTVRVGGALWRARTNRATPIASGDPVRVVSIDGLLLEVEPETGGAKDAHH